MLPIGLVFAVDVQKKSRRKHSSVTSSKKPGSRRVGKGAVGMHKQSRRHSTRRSKTTEKAGVKPLEPGTGTRKRKLKRKPEPDQVLGSIFDHGTTSAQVEDRDEDGEIESFMVTPKSAKDRSVEGSPEEEETKSGETGGKSGDVDSIKPEEATKTRPAFGESLNVGFKGRNSRNRIHRHRHSVSRLESKKKRADDGTKVEIDEPVPMEEMEGTESVITDVDDESYIEWDSKQSEPSKSSDIPEDISTSDNALHCRNCDDLIEYKYIKYYVKKQDNESVRVHGPFCSKMCSLEFSET